MILRFNLAEVFILIPILVLDEIETIHLSVNLPGNFLEIPHFKLSFKKVFAGYIHQLE